MTIKVVQYRSGIRIPQRQKDMLRSLGLRKIGSVRELPSHPSVLGMISKLSHVVKILE